MTYSQFPGISEVVNIKLSLVNLFLSCEIAKNMMLPYKNMILHIGVKSYLKFLNLFQIKEYFLVVFFLFRCY